jgi:hypothetical protein
MQYSNVNSVPGPVVSTLIDPHRSWVVLQLEIIALRQQLAMDLK